MDTKLHLVFPMVSATAEFGLVVFLSYFVSCAREGNTCRHRLKLESEVLMKNSQRVMVYVVGFTLGSLLVSIILSHRVSKEETAVDPWASHNIKAIAGGAEQLPDHMPASIQKGRIIGFGYLPNEEEAEERVWLLNFGKSYPYIRAVETITTGEFSFMAADQILIHLAEGVDVTKLIPMLDELSLRLRMFNRKEDLAVIGVLNTHIDAVPKTIEAVQPWSDLFESVEADVLHFQR